MATVRITDNVFRSVRSKIDHLFTQRLTAVSGRVIDSVTGDELYDQLFSKWEAHLNALPSTMVREATCISLSRVGDLLLSPEPQCVLSRPRRFPMASCDLPDGSRVRVPYNHPTQPSAAIGVSVHNPTGKLLENKTMAEEAVASIKMEQVRQTDTAMKFLKNFATLAPALKAWPALWDLLDEDVKERHRQIPAHSVKRATVERERAEVDLSGLTTLVVASKLIK